MAFSKKLRAPMKRFQDHMHAVHTLPMADAMQLRMPTLHTDLAELANENGPIFRLPGVGSAKVVVVGDAELAKHIMSPRYAGRAFQHRWEDTEFFPFAKWGQMLGASKTRHETSGIFFGNGPEHWTPARRASERGFLHGRAIREAGAAAATSAASALAEEWTARGAGLFNVHSDLRDATLDVVVRVAFGGEEVLDDSANTELKAIYSSMITNFEEVVGVPPGYWWFARRRQSKELHDLANRLRSLLLPVFKQRLRHMSDEPRCIVDLMLASGMSEGSVLLNSLQILGAGHDTTATSLAILLWQLSQNLPLQDAVRSEVYESQDADQPLLSACVKEVLRMWPAAPILVRQTFEDAPPWKGLHFPAGTIALVSPWLLGRSAELWGDPHIFRPQRFMESSSEQAVHRYALIPFGYGLRSCVGQHLAVAELKAFTAVLLHSMRFTVDEPPSLEWFLTLTLRNGLPLHVDLVN